MRSLARALKRAFRPSAALSRREREARRRNRAVGFGLLALLAALGAFFYSLAPSESEKPQITVYMQADCETCVRWEEYVGSHGFRTKRGPSSQLAHIRAQFKLPPGFRGLHTAVVDGLYVEGHVPTSDIQFVLARPDHRHIKGLVVPGLPPGAPGVDDRLAKSYATYAVYEAGMMRVITLHNHFD